MDEKATLLTNSAAAVPRLGLREYNWWSEGLHGVARSGLATAFPQVIGVASALNRSLWRAIANATGHEARGKHNRLDGKLYHGLTLWAPNVNIFRDPRWGRGQETPGEDPLISSEYAAEFVRGLQGEQAISGYLLTSACVKHFAAYSEEEGRLSFAAQVTPQDMVDTYLPAFEAAVRRGRASGLMCSYNAETFGDGLFGAGTSAQHGAVPSCANRYLLTSLAREEWGFDGYVTSDCGATAGVIDEHRYTNSSEDTATAVFSAGMDIDCGSYLTSDRLGPLLRLPTFNATLVDVALARLFTVQMRLGFFDPPDKNPYGRIGPEAVNTPLHQALAKEAADQSLVLLKNEPLHGGGSGVGDPKAPPVLPLSPERVRTVLMVGRHANATVDMLGNYFGSPPFLISPAEGLAAYADVRVAADDDAAADAPKLLRGMDAAVAVVGLASESSPHPDEAEGRDRTTLRLSGSQHALVRAVAAAAAAASVPLVLVVMGGGGVDLSEFKASALVPAVLWCGYPGQAGGAAVADAVFGARSPAGRLTTTWYAEDFVRSVRMKDMGMRPSAASGSPGRTYRFYTGAPVYPFGWGLSYASCKLALELEEKRISPMYPRAGSAGLLARIRSQIELHARAPRAGRASASRATLDAGGGGGSGGGGSHKARHEAVAVAHVTLQSTADRDAAQAVLLFARAPEGTAGVGGSPLISLVGFDRLWLCGGCAASVSFPLSAAHLSIVDSNGRRLPVAGEWTVWVGSSDTKDAVATLRIQ